jgi:hypothetical protein
MGKYDKCPTVFLLIWARWFIMSCYRSEGRNFDRISLTVFFYQFFPCTRTAIHTPSVPIILLCIIPQQATASSFQQPKPDPQDCQLITTSNLRLSSWRVSSVRGSRRKEAQLRIDPHIAIVRDQGCANVLQAWFRLDSLNFCARWCERPGFWLGYWLCQGGLSTKGGKITNFRNICTSETWRVWPNCL